MSFMVIGSRRMSVGGVDVNGQLINAARLGRVEGAKQALQLKANINARDAMGQTALHVACYRGQLEMVAFLMSQGADTTIVSNDGLTAHALAVLEGETDAANIITHGAEWYEQNRKEFHLKEDFDFSDMESTGTPEVCRSPIPPTTDSSTSSPAMSAPRPGIGSLRTGSSRRVVCTAADTPSPLRNASPVASQFRLPKFGRRSPRNADGSPAHRRLKERQSPITMPAAASVASSCSVASTPPIKAVVTGDAPGAGATPPKHGKAGGKPGPRTMKAKADQQRVPTRPADRTSTPAVKRPVRRIGAPKVATVPEEAEVEEEETHTPRIAGTGRGSVVAGPTARKKQRPAKPTISASSKPSSPTAATTPEAATTPKTSTPRASTPKASTPKASTPGGRKKRGTKLPGMKRDIVPLSKACGAVVQQRSSRQLSKGVATPAVHRGEVKAFFKALSLEEYAGMFVKEGFDTLERVGFIEASDLEELPKTMKRGHQKQLLAATARLKAMIMA